MSLQSPSATGSCPGVQRVLAAEAVSNFGSMLSRLAIPWLAALTLQATPAQMALLLVADVLAAGLGGLWLAGWIDRHGKRAAMLLADAARWVVFAVLALAVWQGWVTMALLVAAAALSGVGGMAFELARSAWLAQRVAPAELPRRNAQLSMVGSLSETAAFAIGGWLYQALGAALALLIDACSYALSALCLKGVHEARGEAPAASGRSAWRGLADDAAAGLRAAWAHPALRALMGIEALLAVAMALTGSAYMIHVSRDVALATGPIGVIAALGALGAVAGAMLATRLGARLGPGRTMALGLLAFALGAACIPMAQQAGWVAVAWLVAHQIVGDAGHTLHAVHDRTLRQTAVAPALLARVDAGIRAVGQGATLLGAALAAVLGSMASARMLLWVAAALASAAAALAAATLARQGKPA
jgi:predicted MFS family arabinose efflux permease